MADSHDSPPMVRPIPRRPFDLNLTGPTPLEDQESPLPTPNRFPSALNLDSLNSRLLNNRKNSGLEFKAGSGSGSLSRAQSIMNLTSSTLFGIYAPVISGSGKDRFYNEQDEPISPWGTGAEMPARKLSENEPNHEIQKERGHVQRRRSSLHHPPQRAAPLSKFATALYLGLRALLLFGLGILYGALVATFKNGHKFASLQGEDAIQFKMKNWRYMEFWGVSGVIMGVMLPWFDGVWEGMFGHESAVESQADHAMGRDTKESRPDTDWALVVRGIGAFVGIFFAIRKLSWPSTLQVSLTLALVNPFLWYLIDRSKPGFLLSAAVGLAGSAVLMGLNPDMLPTPPSPSTSDACASGNASSSGHSGSPIFLGGLASQETLETGIWTLSVLFCCCVCFGNIGRRLALNRSTAVAMGRWAERKP